MKAELFQAILGKRDDAGNRTYDGKPEWFVRLTLPDGSTHIARVSQLLSVPSVPGEYLQEVPNEPSQCRAVGERHPRTWDEYEAACCSMFHGGLTGSKLLYFENGMATVFSMLRSEFKEAHECRKAVNDG